MKQKSVKQKQSRRTRSQKIISAVAIAMAALMLIGVLASALSAFAITKKEVDALKKKVAAATAQKNELKSQAASLRSDVSQLEKQLELLDRQMEAQQDEIDAQNELLDELNALIGQKSLELETSEQEEAQQYQRMRERVRFMAEHNSTSYLAILLSSDSFSDFLNRYEIVKQISRRDESLFQQLKEIRNRVALEKQELEDSRAEAETTTAEMDANMRILAQNIADKEKKLGDLKNMAAETQQAYADMVEREEQLMEDYKAAAAKLSSQQTYVGGTFMWPLPASNNVITCPYGMRYHPVTGKYKLHTGIDLRASSGTKVFAANGGSVTTSGYSSAWGNYIIISHGGGITTLYAHLSKRSVSKGDKVKQGSVIGYSGNTGYSTGAHLHFEIDKNGVSYDPLTEFKGFSYVFK